MTSFALGCLGGTLSCLVMLGALALAEWRQR